MATPNERTLEVYERYAKAWSNQHSAACPMVENWLRTAVDGLSHSAAILEVGSGSGRDARFLWSLGYTLTCTDAAASFVSALNADGVPAARLNLLADPLGGPFDLILANAVLVHFTMEDTRLALRKIASALPGGGRFAFTLKEDDAESCGWLDSKPGHLGAPRFFQFWSERGIREELHTAGFEDVRVDHDELDGVPWLQIVANRPAAD